MIKPTFGTTSTNTQSNTSNSERVEIGAIWENSGKLGKYMNIRFKMPKSELLKLVESSNTDDSGNVTVGFVAFPNRSKGENSRRPSFRIYNDSASGNGQTSHAATPTFSQE